MRAIIIFSHSRRPRYRAVPVSRDIIDLTTVNLLDFLITGGFKIPERAPFLYSAETVIAYARIYSGRNDTAGRLMTARIGYTSYEMDPFRFGSATDALIVLPPPVYGVLKVCAHAKATEVTRLIYCQAKLNDFSVIISGAVRRKLSRTSVQRVYQGNRFCEFIGCRNVRGERWLGFSIIHATYHREFMPAENILCSLVYLSAA